MATRKNHMIRVHLETERLREVVASDRRVLGLVGGDGMSGLWHSMRRDAVQLRGLRCVFRTCPNREDATVMPRA